VFASGDPGRQVIEDARTVLFESVKAFWRDDAPFYASGIAFYSLFSMFSLLLLFSLLLGLLGRGPGNLEFVTRFMDGLAPSEASQFIENVARIVSKPTPQRLLPVAMLVTLWTASNVVQAVIHALNRIYYLGDVRAAWRTRLMALGVAGGGAVLLLLGFVLFVFGGDLTAGLAELESLRSQTVRTLLAAKRPIAVLSVFFSSLLIYWLAPRFNQQHRVSWPGALVFTLSWLLVTTLFNLYLRHFAVFDHVYGPMATLVVVLVWVQISAQLVLFGGEVNAAIHRLRRSRAEERAREQGAEAAWTPSGSV
jgi:membrane protein